MWSRAGLLMPFSFFFSFLSPSESLLNVRLRGIKFTAEKVPCMFLRQSYLAGQHRISLFSCHEKLLLVLMISVNLGSVLFRSSWLLTTLFLSSVDKIKFVAFRYSAELLWFACYEAEYSSKNLEPRLKSRFLTDFWDLSFATNQPDGPF